MKVTIAKSFRNHQPQLQSLPPLPDSANVVITFKLIVTVGIETMKSAMNW